MGRVLEFITFYHNAKKAALLQKYISVKKLVFHYFIFVKKQAFYIKSSIFTTVQFVKTAFSDKNDTFLQGPFFYATYIYIYIYKDVENIIAYVVVKF